LDDTDKGSAVILCLKQFLYNIMDVAHDGSGGTKSRIEGGPTVPKRRWDCGMRVLQYEHFLKGTVDSDKLVHVNNLQSQCNG
jgi:hypothetical protein